MLTPLQLRTIDAIVSVFESGAVGRYDAISANPRDAGGLSYGKHQATLMSGSLQRLIEAYCEAPGAQHIDISRILLPFLIARDRGIERDTLIHRALKALAADPVMRRVQDEFFARDYLNPALATWKRLGMTEALSAAVVYDSFIHSGRLNLATQTTNEFGTVKAIGEHAWISAYVDVRGRWLARRFPATAIRMTAFRGWIAAGNWELSLPIRIPRKGGEVVLTEAMVAA